MIGAIVGDVVGSIYEWDNINVKDFPFFSSDCDFTDDTVCTVALADCLLNGGNPVEYLQFYCKKYPGRGYGGMFKEWINLKNPQPYNSFGNGAAMRISPVAYYYDNWYAVESQTIKYTEITHNHLEGLIGALATNEAIFKGFTATDKNYLLDILINRYPTFDISETVDSIRGWYSFNETCQQTVPQALICVLYSTDFEDAIRNAISIGGDSDTLACIVGSIAEAYYKEIPEWILTETYKRLPDEFLEVIKRFNNERSNSKIFN